MTPVEVTLAGYDGWGLFYIWAGGLALLFLALALLLGRKAESTDPHVNGWWILRLACIGLIVLVPVGTFATFNEIAKEHDQRQRAQALAEIGITHAQFTGDERGVRDQFIGSADEKYIVGSFIQIEGEQWLIVGGVQ